MLLLGLAGCGTPEGVASGPPEVVSESTQANRVELPAATRTYTGPVLVESPFKDLIVLAVKDNPGSDASISRIAAAQATAAGAAGAFKPRVSVGADYGVQIAGSANRARNSPYIELSQLIFDAGASGSRRAATNARLKERRSDHVSFLSSLTFQAVETFGDVLRKRDLVALAEKNMGLHRTFLAQVETRVAAGAASQMDTLEARSRFAEATSRAVSAQAELDQANSRYAEVFGSAPAAVSMPPAAPIVTPEKISLTAASSPRVVSMNHAIVAGEADLRFAQSGRFPTVRLGTTGRPGVDGGVDINSGISVDFALITGGEREARIQIAKANLLEIHAKRRELLREVERSITFVRADQKSMALQLDAANFAVSANKANAEAYLEQFDIGRRNITEVLDAQSSFIESSERLINSKMDMALSGYALLAVTGDILGVFGISQTGNGQP